MPSTPSTESITTIAVNEAFAHVRRDALWAAIDRALSTQYSEARGQVGHHLDVHA